MKHIKNSALGWDHRPYWAYLKAARTRIPDHIFLFASDPKNHNLDSANSLHDAWLEEWKMLETPAPLPKRARTISVQVRFLGPRHDRTISLSYLHVRRYQMQLPKHSNRNTNMGHGDLLVHELLAAKSGSFTHELLFSNGATFLFEFEDFIHAIQHRQ